MFEKISRSWSLIKASAAVLRSDSELLVFPLLSSVSALLVLASFAAPLLLVGGPDSARWQQDEIQVGLMVWGFLFYLVQYFVIFFFNTALVGAAMIRLQGGDPTLADGMRIAFSRIGTIFGYAAIAATVGLLLRLIEQRAGAIGKWIAGLLGMAWTFASFLVVPVLVHENVGPLAAVKQSAQLLRKTWGENLVGSGGIGVVGGLLMVLLVVTGIAAAVFAFINQLVGLGITVLVLTVVGALLLGLVQAALTGIYSAALYRYASVGEGSPGFAPALLGSAFSTNR